MRRLQLRAQLRQAAGGRRGVQRAAATKRGVCDSDSDYDGRELWHGAWAGAWAWSAVVGLALHAAVDGLAGRGCRAAGREQRQWTVGAAALRCSGSVVLVLALAVLSAVLSVFAVRPSFVTTDAPANGRATPP